MTYLGLEQDHHVLELHVRVDLNEERLAELRDEGQLHSVCSILGC